MAGVTLTASMRTNLYSLQQTSQLMGTIQNRLSTGKKVNSALDNPNNYFSAQSLTNRATDLSNLLDGMGQAVQAITAASNGITSVQKVVDQMKAVANSAIQSVSGSNAVSTATLNSTKNAAMSMSSVLTGITTAAGATSNVAAADTFTINADTGGAGSALTTFTISAGETMQNLADQIHATFSNLTLSVDSTGTASITNSNAKTITFANGTNTPLTAIFGGVPAVITGSGTDTGTAARNSNSIIAATGTTNLVQQTNSINGLSTAVNTNAANILVTSGDTLTIRLGASTDKSYQDVHTITIDSNATGTGNVQTVNDLLNQLNTISGISASIDSAGKLSIAATGGQQLTIGGSATAGTAGHNLIAAGTTSASASAPSSTYTTQMDGLRSQLDQLVSDASYQGTNLISGTNNSPLTVTFDEKATSAAKLTINAVDLTSSGLGISAASGSWTSAAAVTSALATLTTAQNTLRDTASSLGTNLSTVQTRQDFTTNMVNTLKAGSDSLTLADMNEESANMLALQTRSQLGTQALSLANQANQSVMRLFG